MNSTSVRIRPIPRLLPTVSTRLASGTYSRFRVPRLAQRPAPVSGEGRRNAHAPPWSWRSCCKQTVVRASSHPLKRKNDVFTRTRVTSRGGYANRGGCDQRLVEDCGGIALFAAPMQILHGDVEVDLAAGRFDANHHGFGIGASGKALLVHVNFRWEHLETKALIVKQGHGVSDDHVRKFANGFACDLFGALYRAARKMAGNLQGHLGSQVQNHAPFDVAFDENERGNAFASIGLFVHRQIDDLGGRLKRLREDRVRGIDKRLNEFHSHTRRSPANATGAPAALGSSLST